MDSVTYAHEVAKLIEYPDAGQRTHLARSYAALGLVGETGEMHTAMIKAKDTVITEMGDVCWFLSRLYAEMDAAPCRNEDTGFVSPVTELLPMSAGIAKMVMHMGTHRSEQLVHEAIRSMHVFSRTLHAVAARYGMTLDEVRLLSLAKIRGVC